MANAPATHDLASAPPPKPPWRLVTERLLRNRPALAGGGILAVLYFCATFAAFIGPYSPFTT